MNHTLGHCRQIEPPIEGVEHRRRQVAISYFSKRRAWKLPLKLVFKLLSNRG